MFCIRLIFADDMFILCGAKPQSFSLIDETLKNFYGYSGLQPNLKKRTIFYAGFPLEVKAQLRQILTIREGSFPVKYLGVPLITSTLKHSDCLILKEKMVARVQSWANKHLSYEGRFQLIESVLGFRSIGVQHLFFPRKSCRILKGFYELSCGRVLIYVLLGLKLIGSLSVPPRRKEV